MKIVTLAVSLLTGLTVSAGRASVAARQPGQAREIIRFMVFDWSINRGRWVASKSWNGGEHGDSVHLSISGSNLAKVDSIQWSVRTGPWRAADPQGEYPAISTIDSLGSWEALPRNLVVSSGTATAANEQVIAALKPVSLAIWAGSPSHGRRYLTRIRAVVWQGRLHLQRELKVALSQ